MSMAFSGKLAFDANVKAVNGKQVVNFRVELSDSYKSGGEWVTKWLQIDCSYWLAPGIAAYLKKDTVVSIVGRLEVQQFTGKDNSVRSKLACHVSEVKLLTRFSKRAAADTNVPVSTSTPQSDPSDDLPF